MSAHGRLGFLEKNPGAGGVLCALRTRDERRVVPMGPAAHGVPRQLRGRVRLVPRGLLRRHDGLGAQLARSSVCHV